jgi:holliday junction DNA helicase RuvB
MKVCNLFSKLIGPHGNALFEDIVGYDYIKRLFRMALDSSIHTLMVGPPATAKTMFLTSLRQLKNSYFTDGANSAKAGMIDYFFENRPKYVDEIDKMFGKDQAD